MIRGSSALLLVSAIAAAAAPRPEPVVRDVFLMGTRARLAAWTSNRAEGLETLERALRVLEHAEAELSTWREDSVISRLNRQPPGTPFNLPPALCDTFAALGEWHAATAGTFDPVIGRLTDAWGIHAGGRVPPELILREARLASGFGRLAFDPRRCRVVRSADATIDVGAFGKGEALDRVERALGEVSWLIDLGGQVSVHGTPPEPGGWPIDIAHPLARDRTFMQIRMREGSLATSGGSERDLVVDGRRVGHILDPRSGGPASFTGAVTVWHRRGLAADALSTALFVMGPDEGLRWAESRAIAACYLTLDGEGDVIARMTPAFRNFLS